MSATNWVKSRAFNLLELGSSNIKDEDCPKTKEAFDLEIMYVAKSGHIDENLRLSNFYYDRTIGFLIYVAIYVDRYKESHLFKDTWLVEQKKILKIFFRLINRSNYHTIPSLFVEMMKKLRNEGYHELHENFILALLRYGETAEAVVTKVFEKLYSPDINFYHLNTYLLTRSYKLRYRIAVKILGSVEPIERIRDRKQQRNRKKM